MSNFPQIIVGTYEEFLLGYEIERQADKVFKLNLNMASHAHQASIRCVASHRHLLASSGADEYVNVFTMINRKELAVLTPHAGTVTALAFAPDGSHLISGSQDGSIAIFRCSDWTLMKIWKDAHKKANGVIGLGVHPTGKMLLSIGADHILRVWNLVKGRQAYAVNYNKRISPGNTLNLVSWSVDGSHYAIALGQTVEVFHVETAAIIYSIKAASRVSCFDLSQAGLIVLGEDDGLVEVHDYIKKEPILEQQCHDKRIKCLQLFKHSDNQIFCVTADSSGVIRLWRWMKEKKQVQKLLQDSEITSDCRIVCMTLLDPDEFVKKEADDKSKVVEESKNNSVIEEKVLNGKRKNDSQRENKKRASLNFSISKVVNTPPANKSLTASTSKWNVT